MGLGLSGGRLLALLVCLLLAISLIPPGSAQTEKPEALLPEEMPVWVTTESLEANTTTLLATLKLGHLLEGMSQVNLSLIHSDKGWNFTIEATDEALAEGENTTVQIHVRPPAEAKDGDRAQAVLMIEKPGELASVPVFLRFETPAVNGNSPVADASVNGTGSATGDAPDTPETPDAPSDPQDKSGEDWAWYVADTAVDTYNELADQWPENPIPDTEPMIGVGLHQVDRYAPTWVNPPNLVLRPPNSMTQSPLPPGESIFVGPPLGEGRESPASASQEGGYTWTSHLFSSRAQGSIDRSGTNGIAPGDYEPNPGNTGYKSPDDQPDGKAPMTTTESEVVPSPFDPVVGAVALVGFAGGALIGTAVLRPESLLARWFTKIVSGLGFAKLFSRTTGPAVLKHPLRSQIHDVITREPGITISVLAKSMDVNRSTLRDHLRTLEREGLIQSRSNGKACHLYPKGKATTVQKDLPRETFFYRHRSKLAQAVVAQPGLAQRQLAEMVNLPRSRVCVYVRSLVEAGLVEAKRDGPYLRYFPTPTLNEMDERILCPA